LAIPMASVSSVGLYSSVVEKTVLYNSENMNTYVCLPLLFNCGQDVKHALVLKDGNDDENDIVENKIILLTSEIENETELPSNNIYPVPKALSVMKFSLLFNGIILASHNKREERELILLLAPELIVQNIKKELFYD